ncbi:metastasis-associated protein 1 (mta1),putative [Schistosoma mansoni]|uniref:metastasis-associated protein 1 (mta1),putative n=1 Tax=Schistosoma mansoni TaxID=6183 RepID=UPI0001A62135|nr:metastasis-associated protein 1 (mta1),putative [Schistosoma mansoni]|eukprot:XP_018644365.1 metastasis-associated protein 1 (mta1),putative [Schistosoma mansoni]
MDFVYFESSATAPYQIRRIDELNKTPTGAVEAKVACYYRRRDVSSALINQAEKYCKCSVTLHNDAEPLTNYLVRDEAFYYKLIYDPTLKTLQEDRGSMRIGSDYQSEIQCLLKSSGQPIIYRDQLEDWSANETNLFEEALDKYSKVFADILSNCLPWKTHKSIVELYYFWKTTDRYVRQRRTKLAAQEHKLKQVYIPNYNKPNPAVLYHNTDKTISRPCEGCGSLNSSQWYAWGPSNANSRLCTDCWSYWKRYGGLKSIESKERPTTTLRTQQQLNSSTVETNSKSGGPINITGSVNHQFKSHSIGLSSGVSDALDGGDIDIYTNDHHHNNNTSATNMTDNANSKLIDGSGFFGTLAGTPRGTQCFRTPSIIRLARILCPNLVQPLRLARHPGGVPEIFSSKQQIQHESKCDESNLTGTDNLSESNMMLMYATLKAAAQPIISRIRDPSILLTRPRRTRRLNDVIDLMASRKGIVFQPLDLSSALKLSVANGPVYDRKRPHSPVFTNAPSSKKLHETDDKVNRSKNSSMLTENITSEKCLTNGRSTASVITKSDCSLSPTSTAVSSRPKKSAFTTDPSLMNQNLILTSNGISTDDRTTIISKFESELIQ